MENEKLIAAGPWIILTVAIVLLILKIRMWRRGRCKVHSCCRCNCPECTKEKTTE